MAEVTVLLATYNGKNYIRQMVDSVLNQTWKDLHIVLSDDGSSDGTVDILEEYAEKNPERVTHYRSGRRFGNAQDHFMHLLSAFREGSPYFMFCDQDDVWHEDKVEKTLKKMREVETDPHRPAMVHTDLRVVDGELRELSPSFMQYSCLDGNRLALPQLLMQNVVTGCTMMVNRALADLSCREIPKGAVLMHDWWLALLASACGNGGFLPESTIDYRQHGNNTVGAKNSRSLGYILGKLRGNMRDSMEATAHQAEALAQVYGDVLSPEALALLRDFGGCFRKGKFTRLGIYRRYGLWKNGTHRKVAQVIWG